MKTRLLPRIASTQRATVALAALSILAAAPHIRGANADRTDAAIARGLAFLGKHQKEDGSLGATDSHNPVGVSSLAGLAWIGSAEHAGNAERVAKYIVASQRGDGFISAAAPRGGSMYDHGFATLFLAKYAKSAAQPALKEPLAKAVALIVKSQGPDGAWRYQPVPTPGDVSVTSCQLVALTAAKEAGAVVHEGTIERAITFLKQSQNPDGGFRYVAGGGASAFPRSAAALAAALAASLSARELAPTAAQPDASRGAAYVLGFLPDGTRQQAEGGFFMHGQYYAGLALRSRGGEPFTRWRDAVEPALLGAQGEDGAWSGQVSPEFATSEACLILQTAKAGR